MMKLALHENGPWKNENGLLCHTSGACTQAHDAAVMYDNDPDCTTLLKAGDKDMVNRCFATYAAALSEKADRFPVMKEMLDQLTVIEFSESNLNPDQVCTILNFMNNSPSKISADRILCNPSNEDRIRFLNKLQDMGF